MIDLCGSPPRTLPSAKSYWLNFVSDKDEQPTRAPPSLTFDLEAQGEL